MKLQELLSFDDYKEGLKALYSNYDLKLGCDINEPIVVPDYLELEITEQERQEYIKERQDFIDDANYLKTTYGWCLSELWELDTTIFQFILPRIYVFYKTDILVEDEDQIEYEDGTFKQILEDILEGLLLVVCTNDYINVKEDIYKKEEIINKSINLLFKYIRRLWN